MPRPTSSPRYTPIDELTDYDECLIGSGTSLERSLCKYSIFAYAINEAVFLLALLLIVTLILLVRRKTHSVKQPREQK